MHEAHIYYYIIMDMDFFAMISKIGIIAFAFYRIIEWIFFIVVNYETYRKRSFGTQVKYISIVLFFISVIIFAFTSRYAPFLALIPLICFSQALIIHEQGKSIKDTIWIGMNTWQDDYGNTRIERYTKKKKILLIVLVVINICVLGVIIRYYYFPPI